MELSGFIAGGHCSQWCLSDAVERGYCEISDESYSCCNVSIFGKRCKTSTGAHVVDL